MCTQLFQFLNLPICWSVFWWHFTPSCGAWAFGLLQVIFPGFFLFSFVLIFITMAYRNSRWNSRVKKVFYLFFVGVLSISRNAFFVTREAFVVLEFAFATPVCYVTNFLLFTVIHKSNESQCTQLITSLRSVRIVVLNEPQRARPSAITTYANIRRWYHFFQFFVWFISFILERKRSIALSFGQTFSPAHAIGVILNLAWGPNNFSPSMIWSWRTRSNSQTGLGAE